MPAVRNPGGLDIVLIKLFGYSFRGSGEAPDGFRREGGFEVASANHRGARGGLSGARRAGAWLARAPRIAEWGLLALIAFLLARIAIDLFAPLPLPKGERLAAVSAVNRETAQVIGRNPFPVSAQAAAPVADAPDVAETALDLGLNGVWPAEEKPSAIIRRPDGKQRRYAVGEDIVPGVRLVEVYADRAIIEQNGVREAVRFENKKPIDRPAPQQNQPAPAPPAQQSPDKIANLQGAGALDNLVRFGLGVDPNGGAAVMVFAGRDRAAFEAAGFRDGDIVRTINGVAPSANPSQMSALLGEIGKTGAATVVIERDGVQQTLALSLSQSGKE